ncbi:MAG: efflux RND transporter periplasmic adaptor subunit [Gammaproteobacteria bacterium]|nr:efflux RND transporter periplasmic adaptor subunit [Gammaproteobacteria bacterium]
MKLKQSLLILVVVILGLIAGAFILHVPERATPTEEHGDAEHKESSARDDHDAAPARGPHGGRAFVEGDFVLESTIYEAGIPPEFRFYATSAGQPLPPSEFTVEVTLKRLGQSPQIISFEAAEDYRRGLAEIVEPHSFEVAIRATWRGKSYAFGYAQEEGRVRMGQEEIQRASIELLTAGPRRIADTLHLPGEIHLNRDRLVHVVSPLDGIAVSVLANAGDRVRRDQILAIVSSQSLALLRNRYTAAEARLALARQVAKREADLWHEGISPEQDYQKAAHDLRAAEIETSSARQQLAALGLPIQSTGNPAQFALRALSDGTVIAKHLAVGEGVTPQSPVFSLADLSTVWAEAKVGARDIGRVAADQVTRVHAPNQDLAAEGKLSYISALLGEADRAVTVRVVLADPEQRWRPGLPVTLEIETGAREVPVAVAHSGLQTLRDWQVVFGRYGEYFEARPLTLGASDGTWVEVLAGLQAGEQYAGTNSYVIKADIGKAGASHDH